MKLSANGTKFLQDAESCRFVAYRDIKGVLTIGWGHTAAGIAAGLTWTQAQCDAQFVLDIAKFEYAVNTRVIVPLTQNQFDALVIFAYNVGIGALAGSTLLRLLNLRDYEGAADQFLVWDKVTIRGVLVVSPGLDNRRAAEKALFDTV